MDEVSPTNWTLAVLWPSGQTRQIDAAAKTKNENIAQIHNQITMMLGHELFDPDINKKILVDHAFIVAGGEINEAGKNTGWVNALMHLREDRYIHGPIRNFASVLSFINVLMPDEETRDLISDELPF